MSNNTTLITADYLYLIFVGSEQKITDLCSKLVDSIYIKHKINIPCAEILYTNTIYNILHNDTLNISDDKKNIYKKYVIIGEGVEVAHCLTYADILSNNLSFDINELEMMLKINNMNTHFELSFPILQLDKEENPEILISRWLKLHNIDNIITELIIRPINIVNNQHDILVFLAFISH